MWNQPEFVKKYAGVSVTRDPHPQPPVTVVLTLTQLQAQRLERFLASGGHWSPDNAPPTGDPVLSVNGLVLNSIQEPLMAALDAYGVLARA